MPRRLLVTSEQFRTARRSSGLSREQAAELVGVSLRTIGHWETGRARPQYAAFKLLRIFRHGDLIDPRWSGYSIIRGKLVTPENHTFEPHELTWLSLLVRRARAFSELLVERDRRAAYAAEAAESARGSRDELRVSDSACTPHAVATFGTSMAGSNCGRVFSPATAAIDCSANDGNPDRNTPLPIGGVSTSRSVFARLTLRHSPHLWNGAPSSNTGWNRIGGAL